MRGIGLIGMAANALMSLGDRITLDVSPSKRLARGPRPGAYRWRSTWSKSYPAGLNGKRAVARRLRQIAAGSLTVANGLDMPGAVHPRPWRLAVR